MDGLLSDLANAIPGIDEAMSFAEMLKLVQTMDYSVIVFDTAPTGHTLRLLQFPSTLEKGLVKMMSLKSKFGGLLGQMGRLFGVGDEFGEDAILGRLEGMKEVIQQVNGQFKDPVMMASTRKNIGSLSRKIKQRWTSGFHLHVGGMLCSVDRELLAEKSSRVAQALKEKPDEENLCFLLGEDIPTDPQTFELVARYCHGYAIDLTPHNFFQVSWLAYYLGMTEDHRPNNLLKMAYLYFRNNVLPSWNKTITALTTMSMHTEGLDRSMQLGLIHECVESLTTQALHDPRLLCHERNLRRTLFSPDWQTEDLAALGIKLYEPIMADMICRRVPLEYASASLCHYFNKNRSTTDRREVIEAIQRLLPPNDYYEDKEEDEEEEKELVVIPFTTLLEMLKTAVESGASEECKDGLEDRVGKRLDEVTVQDLISLSEQYSGAEEQAEGGGGEKYDIECLKRLMKSYCCNYRSSDVSGLVRVGEVMNEFLAEVSRDLELKMETFVSLAELSSTVAAATHGCSDGLYRAVDVYLEAHGWLTEQEKEMVCGALDCSMLSTVAREHAVRNQRLPLRLVVRVLFVAIGEMKLRDTATIVTQAVAERSEEDEEGTRKGDDSNNMNTVLRENDCGISSNSRRNNSSSVWKKFKRKLGCVTSTHHESINCHVKRNKQDHTV
ncbi:unnamed protein product [Cuscuta europaea]|uniref:NPH3 domain-containing protein n=1 Tax=Cuscuta europaea TaxID=41803 RepID=A0A9P0ZE63_CUSEU|nr:unnamed protein product [Cuscuta europaea]